MEEPVPAISPVRDFHAVYVPIGDNMESDDEQPYVFRDKTEALKVIKKFKRARLKTFRAYEDAVAFARNGLEAILANPLANCGIANAAAEDKGNVFKAPRPQNLTQLRKLIEKNDINAVRTQIWENPRYLVSSGDTPSILHEGSRYNALHVAVKSAQSPAMCELILNTVGDPEFVKLFYGNTDEKKNYVNRSHILQDLYLNTPDKGLNETPLHFATKFGLKECVKVLLSYPQCLKSPLNKHHETPIDIICSRKFMDDAKLKSEIRSLIMDEQYYVPVLRAEDNSVQPKIGDPFSPASPPQLNTDPFSPRIEVRAIAGPMTKAQALDFRKKWKTPPRILLTPNSKGYSESNGLKSPGFNSSFRNSSLNSPFRSPIIGSPFNPPAWEKLENLNSSFRFQDTDKGLEMVGRELASECQVLWKEYWPFLKDFADLRSEDGLKKLEEFLRKQHRNKMKFSFNIDKKSSNTIETVKANENNINDLCSQLESLVLQTNADSDDESQDDSEFVTPPSSPLKLETSRSSEEDMDCADERMGDEVFLEGKNPTKTDYAVFRAIPPYIDVSKFPAIYLWRHDMQLLIKNSTGTNMSSSKYLPSKRRLFLHDV
ncbi:ankyrin repeat and LEM domain-containing protein 2 [Trichogramma pretiosum]|uniref:ankyrin repeat and LEM domain-containing protein 2 n=1 Tax=Trichogramma pretiosum TaxID=7493 RepID=UPI0006C99E20|nr:ankyrin repeat and LEM domain-containing protein 2 [Trichogramma pretiosum]